MANDIKEKEAPKKGFKMPDIYIILGCFILVMAVLTYIAPAGQYDRQVVETAHGVQNLVVSGTYKTVEQHPAGFFDIITAIPLSFDRAVGIVVLTFMVGACMGLIKRAGLIDLGVQRLSRAVGTSEFLVAPILMFVLSLLAAFIGVPELSLAYLPVFLPLIYGRRSCVRHELSEREKNRNATRHPDRFRTRSGCSFSAIVLSRKRKNRTSSSCVFGRSFVFRGNTVGRFENCNDLAADPANTAGFVRLGSASSDF